MDSYMSWSRRRWTAPCAAGDWSCPRSACPASTTWRWCSTESSRWWTQSQSWWSSWACASWPGWARHRWNAGIARRSRPWGRAGSSDRSPGKWLRSSRWTWSAERRTCCTWRPPDTASHQSRFWTSWKWHIESSRWRRDAPPDGRERPAGDGWDN